MQRYLPEIGAARGGQTTEFQRTKRQCYDLPRLASAKVALHLLEGLGDPSFKEGILPKLNVCQSSIHLY
jgi:hypothetical protein